MKDKQNLNAIFETVYDKSPQQQEKFLNRYNRHDDHLLESDAIKETATASAGGSSSIESAAPEHTIEVVNGQDKKTLTEAFDTRKMSRVSKIKKALNCDIAEAQRIAWLETRDDYVGLNMTPEERDKVEYVNDLRLKGYFEKGVPYDPELVYTKDWDKLTEASVPGFKNMSTQGYESDLSDESRMIDEMNAEDDDYNEFGPYGSEGVEEPSESEQAFWDSQDMSEPAGDDIPSDEEIERQMAAWAEEDEERDRENSSPGAQMKDYVDTVSKEEEEQWDKDHPFDDPEDNDLSGMEDEMFGDDYDEDYDPEDDDLSGMENDYNEFGPYGSEGVEEPSEDEQAFWDSQDNSEEDSLDKQTYHENINKRLELRKKLNESLFEAIDNKRLKEELDDEDSVANLTRYQLQKFTNGGTPMGDGQIDGESDGPSSYEAWRRGINDKKRKARFEQENIDRNSDFASPKTTRMPRKMLDGQQDDFLYEWMKERKQPMELTENIDKRIDDFLESLNESYFDQYGPIGLMMDGASEIGNKIRRSKRRKELKKEGHDDDYIETYLDNMNGSGHLTARGSNLLNPGSVTHFGSGMPANSLASTARFRDICIIYEGRPDQIVRWARVKFPWAEEDQILEQAEMYTGSPDFERRKAKYEAKKAK